MDKQNKPLSDWTLQEIRSYCCEQDNCEEPTVCAFFGDNRLCIFRNTTPDSWDLSIDITRPRLTDEELERCRVYGAKWVSRDKNCDDGSVDLWRVKPLYGDGMYNNTEDGGLIATIHNSVLFPSVHPGECIAVENT